MNNASRLSGVFISLAYIPAGLLGLYIAEKLPANVRLSFYILLSVGIIYYRLAGAQKLRKKFMGRSNR